MKSSTMPLGYALLSVSCWPEDSSLLLPSDEAWRTSTQCVVTVSDPYAEEDPSAEVDGRAFHFVLQKEQVEDIIANTQQQLSSPSEQDTFLAFLFYFARDAFIDWVHFAQQGTPADVLAAASRRQGHG